MFIKFFCSFLHTSSITPIRLDDTENLAIYDLIIAVYGEHKITFEKAKVGLRELEFFALVRPASIWDAFFKVICYLAHSSNLEPPRNAGRTGHGRIDER